MTKLKTNGEMTQRADTSGYARDPNPQPKGAGPGAMFCFLRGFLANPADVASVVPSSRFLQQQLSSLPCIESAETVVELGPGTGSTTQALLGGMDRQARLLCIELVPEFAAHLRRTTDERVNVVTGSALDLERHLQEFDMPAPDVIVSGIPFSTMPKSEGQQLIECIHDALAPEGRFVAYQVRDHVSQLAERHFGPPETSLVLWNLPPLRIYRWTKSNCRPRSIPR